LKILNHREHRVHGEGLHSDLSEKIIGCAIAVHAELGPGLLEGAYRACLAHELILRGIKIVQERPMPVTYRGLALDTGYRLDLVVEDVVIVELKAVDSLLPIHHAQLLTYLKLSGLKLGLLINFNTKLLTQGIKRMVL
jgi:GxxExxY protein